MTNINKRISVTLTEKEMEFIKKLAKHDNTSVAETLQNLFYLQLKEEIDYYEESGF